MMKNFHPYKLDYTNKHRHTRIDIYIYTVAWLLCSVTIPRYSHSLVDLGRRWSGERELVSAAGTYTP